MPRQWLTHAPRCCPLAETGDRPGLETNLPEAAQEEIKNADKGQVWGAGIRRCTTAKSAEGAPPSLWQCGSGKSALVRPRYIQWPIVLPLWTPNGAGVLHERQALVGLERREGGALPFTGLHAVNTHSCCSVATANWAKCCRACCEANLLPLQISNGGASFLPCCAGVGLVPRPARQPEDRRRHRRTCGAQKGGWLLSCAAPRGCAPCRAPCPADGPASLWSSQQCAPRCCQPPCRSASRRRRCASLPAASARMCSMSPAPRPAVRTDSLD